MNQLELTTPTDTEIHIQRSFAAPAARVWRAFVEPQLVQQWLTGPPGHTMPVCEIDFRTGGAWRYVWQMPEGEIEALGIYREIVDGEQIVYTEAFGDWPDLESLVTVTFREVDAVTTVLMQIAYDSQLTRDSMLSTPMEQGMAASYTNLDALLVEGNA